MGKKYEGKVMSEEELKDFVEHVGRSELYEEYVAFEKSSRLSHHMITSTSPVCYYKGISATLSSLGYDSMWVSDVAMPAVRDRYSEEAYKEAVEKVDKAWGPYRSPSNR